MTPQAVAFLGLVICWTFPPLLALPLALDSSRCRWVSRGFAFLLLALWAPLLLGAPDLLRALQS